MKENMIKYNIIKLLITFAILFFVITFFNVNILNSVKQIEKQKYIWISLLVPVLINPLISNNRWRIFLSVQGINEKFFYLVKVSFVSIFLGVILPATTGSDMLRIYRIEKKHKNNIGSGGASVIVERILGFLILSFLGLFGSIVAVAYGASYYILFLSGILHLTLILVIIILKNDLMHSFIEGLLKKIQRWKTTTEYISSLYTAVNKFPLKKVLRPTIPLILAFQLSTIFCGYMIFLAFDVNIPIYYHLAFLPLIQIISILPVSISGFGVRESGFVFFYSLIGVNADISFLVSLLYYAVLVIVPAFIGMIIYVFDNEYRNN